MIGGPSLSVCLVGASGRMGAEIIKACSASEKVVAGIVAPDDPLCGKCISGIEAPLTSSWEDSCDSCNIIIDFSSQAGTELALSCAIEKGVPVVSGTTGLSPTVQEAISKASEKVPILRASNFSVGVNLLFWLVGKAASALGPSFDIEIVETHHRMKKDSPSGTAISLADAAAKGRDVNLSDVLRCSREGRDAARKDGEITVLGLRGGDVVGEHTVHFLGNHERVEFTHRATNRAVFAIGALRAAEWLKDKKAGLYSMQDLLSSSF